MLSEAISVLTDDEIYILENPDSCVFSSLTVSIGGDTAFELGSGKF